MKEDFVTIGAHKFHGPPGIGALYSSNPEVLRPVYFGGHQQGGLQATCFFKEKEKKGWFLPWNRTGGFGQGHGTCVGRCVCAFDGT